MKKKRLMAAAAAMLAMALAGQVVAGNLSTAKIKNAYVRYVPAAQVKTFPLPVVHFDREGLATAAQKAEVMQRLVYPMINRSRRPIAMIRVEFYTDDPQHLGFTTYWHDGGFDGLFLSRDRNGKIPPNTISSRPDAPQGDD